MKWSSQKLHHLTSKRSFQGHPIVSKDKSDSEALSQSSPDGLEPSAVFIPSKDLMGILRLVWGIRPIIWADNPPQIIRTNPAFLTVNWCILTEVKTNQNFFWDWFLLRIKTKKSNKSKESKIINRKKSWNNWKNRDFRRNSKWHRDAARNQEMMTHIYYSYFMSQTYDSSF